MTKHILLAAATIAAAAPAPAQPYLAGATGEIALRILTAHNVERARVGAPPLQWDSTLAAHAASYGPELARMRTLVHSPRAGRPGERENLAMAWHGTMSPEQLVGMWSDEKRLLAPGSAIFPGASRTGRWEDIAHYTQMVWPTTTRVGCAIYSADWDYLICRYSPPGNIDGKPMFVAARAGRIAS
ncbi:MAG TPA: CAP domain-containing protein [Sphingomicrobium sp.]|nr:CAP domain-containing protein [Sphingomicrobium sp.]